MALPPPSNKYLDLINNRQPLVSGQIINVLAALVVAFLDKNVIHFTDPAVDPSGLMTGLVVYFVVALITTAWAWGKVWSNRTHQIVVAQAAATGNPDPGNPPADIPPPAGG